MSVCVNDTDGDGDCAACARNPNALCRVSARDKLTWMAEDYHGYPDDEINAELDAYREEIRHEAAEEVRAEVDTQKVHDPGYREVHEGMLDAADLIDPERTTK